MVYLGKYLQIATVLILIGCTTSGSQPLESTSNNQMDYWPTDGWRESTPNEVELNQAILDDLVNELEGETYYKNIHSLLIIKDGYLVLDKYFDKYPKDDTHTLQSVTKSITSTLIGAAIQQKFIKDLDQKIISFFPEYKSIANMDANKKAMTLKHALTMRTGQAWYGERHLGALNRDPGDRMKHVLDYKMAGNPGEKWYYNSGIAVLLGGLFENATKMNTEKFADDYLFHPLGIEKRKWYSHKGIPHTGGGLGLRPQDLAKIGYLFLNDGVWGNQRILPEGWVSEATSRHVQATTSLKQHKTGYGYMWWLFPLDKQQKNSGDFYAGYGYMGQFLFVIPQYQMIVVVNGGTKSYMDEIKPIEFVYKYILKSVKK